MSKSPSAFQWQEDSSQSRYGEGISHAKKGARTKTFKLLVRNAQMAVMKVELKAENKTAALSYGKARWPHAAIEVVK